LSIYDTPSYYVQKLFSNNKGSKLLSINSSIGGTQGSDSLYASAVMDTVSGELILKMVNASARRQDCNFIIQGTGKCKDGKLTVLQSGDLKTTNSFEQPFNLLPKESIISLQKKGLQYAAPPYSLSVMRIKYTRES
jgi:alpha-L-arabinofuranosidase